MKTEYRVIASCIGLALGAGCISEDAGSSRIAVTTENDLGITMLQVDRFDEHGEASVELRAFDANHAEVAMVRRHTGDIADLATYAPGDDLLGSEVVFAAADQQQRVLTRATDVIDIRQIENPTIRSFVRLPEVASTLANAAKIELRVSAGSATPGESAYTSTASCAASKVLTSPVARECCATLEGSTYLSTWFINPTSLALVTRETSIYGGCRSSSGATCSGSACYYGPNGFTRASLYPPDPGYNWNVENPWIDFVGNMCTGVQYAGSSTNYFANVTGTYPTARGCCINGAGPCGPGITACSACGGGNSGAAGIGAWDY